MASTQKNNQNNQQEALLKWHYFIWAIVILIMAVSVLITEKLDLIQAVNEANYNLASQKTANSSETIPSTAVMSLKLQNQKELKMDENYTADIVIDTDNNAVIAVDAYLEYDPQKIQIQSVNAGSLFATYPSQSYSQEKGQIIVSGIAMENESYTGSGIFGSISFTPIATGSAEINFSFIPNDSRDCNIISGVNYSDILGSVSNLSFMVNQNEY